MARGITEELIPLKDMEEYREDDPQTKSDNLTMKYWQYVEGARTDENEKSYWKIPFAFGTSITDDSNDQTKVVMHRNLSRGDSMRDEEGRSHQAIKKFYDIIEIPILENPDEIDFRKYAESLKTILGKGKDMKYDVFNFKSQLDYYNMIIYIPEIKKSGQGLLAIPNTAIAILGKVITDLLTKNKAWIIVDARAKGPITNLVLESLERAKLEVKQITPRIRKRLIFLGLYDKPLRTDFNAHATNTLTSKRYQISNDGCKELLKTMTSSAVSKVLQSCVVLRHDHPDGKLVKEHILYELSQLLKIPGLKLEFVVQPGMTSCYEIRTEFLNPYSKEIGPTKVYNFYRKEPELYEMILQQADEYFYQKLNFKGWNTMTTALFLRDQKRVKKALERVESDGIEAQKQSQIGRILRYALFYGSREIVENIFNNSYIQTCLVSQREMNLTGIFKKSGTELILFQRLMYALTKDEEYVEKRIKDVDDFTQSLEVVKFLQLAIEKLMGDGFLWNIPDVQKHDVLSSKTHYEVYFAEYIMVWGALSQRYEVAELFLEYSGGHLQELSTVDREFYSTQKGVYQIANALAISRLLYGVEKELRFDTAVSTDDSETLIQKAAHFEEIAVGLLDNAISKNEFTLNELFETKIPFWNQSTAIELASTAGEQLFFTHEGVQGHVRNVWSGIAKLQAQYEKSESDQNININVHLKNSFRRPWKRDSLQFFYTYYISPSTTFYIHALVYFLFLVLYTVHVLITWNPDPRNGYVTFDVIYFLYLSAYILDEVFQYRYLIEDKAKGKHVKHNQYLRILKSALFDYLSSGWNILDIAIAISFITTVTLRITVFVLTVEDSANALMLSAITRLVYGLVGVLLYMRFFQYVLVFRGLGPLIYTCYIAFKRMLKFLVIFSLVSLGFGIIEVTLTTTTETGWALLRVLLFSPYYQIFGVFELNTLQDNSISFVSRGPNSTDDVPPFWESTTFIGYFFLILLQLIANVLLLNLMIAYFTKIFNEISENADSIYLTQFLEVVEEYQRKSFFPPPFNIPVYLLRTFGICKTVCLDFFTDHDEKEEDEFERDTQFNRAKVYPVYFGHHNENGFADEYWRAREKIRVKDNFQMIKRQEAVGYLTQRSQEQNSLKKYTV